MNLLLRARRFALLQHAGQRRPNASQEPFALHLAEVAGYVADEGWPEPVVAAAWLHDVVEDTQVTLGDQVSNVRSVVDDPPTGWDASKCLAYLAGAAEVAAACGGVAPRLEALVAVHHARGMAKYLGAKAHGAGPGAG